MSAYSDWKCGALSDDEYRSATRWELRGDEMYNDPVSRCEGFDSCKECIENGCGCDDPDDQEEISKTADRLFNKIMGGNF